MGTTITNEESLNKSTDCVYFLASPLTCKKGSECEFRHSETARINPRDCWYWLSGSCLNSHCPFRHPPLEGLSEVDSSALQSSAISRPRVPCYYFSQGYCAKGDKCIFMHGLAAELHQKIPKPNVVKADDSQTKLNGLKPSPFECNEIQKSGSAVKCGLKSGEKEVDVKVMDIASTLSEGSDSSASAKPQIHSDDMRSNKISRQGCAVNDGICDLNPVDDNFLHLQEIQAEDETLCRVQPIDEDPHLAHLEEDERIQNGTESEELWEESSFDVLVDDGADQLIYAEDMDFISPCEGIVDPLRAHIQAGMLGVEGFTEYDYEHGGEYDQYYDATEYELATYEAYEQQLAFDQLYRDGMQKDMGLKGSEVNEMLQKERWGVGIGAEEAAVGSDDLRNHIVKRRRAERNQRLEEDFHRRQYHGNGVRHGQRQNKDVTMKSHDGQGRNGMLMREFPERGEPPKNKRFQGRLGENLGGKRPYSGMVIDHEEMGADRDSSKKPDNHFNGKSKRGDVVRNRGNNTLLDCSKVQVKNDDISFQGPKTLAQIKAEKMRVSKDGISAQNHDSLEDANKKLTFVPSRQTRHTRNVSPVPRNMSPVRGSNNELISKELVCRDGDSFEEADRKSYSVPRHHARHIRNVSPVAGINTELASKDSVKGLMSGDAVTQQSDFEGPKPLSVILKEKRKEVTIIQQKQVKPVGLEKADNFEDLDSKGRSTSTNSKFSAAIKLRDDDSLAVMPDGYGQKTTDLLYNSRAPADGIEPHKYSDDSIFDADEKLDAGDSVLEDAEFDDDDEDDDFAKKLGGFCT